MQTTKQQDNKTTKQQDNKTTRQPDHQTTIGKIEQKGGLLASEMPWLSFHDAIT